MGADTTQAAVDGAKIVSVWTAVHISSWADAASAVAALYTMLLIGEWTWKKILRPFAETRGWIKRKFRRSDDK